MSDYAAIVLAGGTGRRLGGVDKATVPIAGRSLLDRALDAVQHASARIVVGPTRPETLPGDVLLTRERPALGGPVAALAAGLAHVSTPVVVVLACDMPLVTTRVMDQLVDVLLGSGAAATVNGFPEPAVHGAVLRDDAGRRQPLAGAYLSAALRSALAALPTPHGASMRDLLTGLELLHVPAIAGTALDCDTWDDVAACRHELAPRPERERSQQTVPSRSELP